MDHAGAEAAPWEANVKLFATVLQLAGMASLIFGAWLEYAAAGGIAAAGVVAVFIGLALERDG